MALSDAFIRAVKHSGKAGNDEHADGQGLYLAVTPAGGKLWRLDYRFAGKRKTLALGAYPAVGAAKARRARDDAREQLAQGVDPSAHKREQKAAKVAAASNTFEAVARDWLDKTQAKRAATAIRQSWGLTSCTRTRATTGRSTSLLARTSRMSA